MQKILQIDKRVGETPLEAIEKFRENHPEYEDVKMAYAGRLDPMASGLLLVLIGEECRKRDQYQNLDKVYEFEIILGIETDSLDILGLITKNSLQYRKSEILPQLERIVAKFPKKFKQKYPLYSSKTINGKPLYWWTRNNRLGEIDIPEKTVEIFNLEMIENREETTQKLVEEIQKRVKRLKGNFRQNEILTDWEEFKTTNTNRDLQIVKLRAKVSSGTYIRSIAEAIGEQLEIGVTSFEIRRICVGEFKLN
jgi:tRNA pseudouridine55 synthase